MKNKQKNKLNEEEQDNEPKAFVQMGDIVVACDNVGDCSKIALSLHRSRYKKFKPRYV